MLMQIVSGGSHVPKRRLKRRLSHPETAPVTSLGAVTGGLSRPEAAPAPPAACHGVGVPVDCHIAGVGDAARVGLAPHLHTHTHTHTHKHSTFKMGSETLGHLASRAK